MRFPRFLLGAGLLFWGWQTDLLWLGFGAALAVESARFIKTRWSFSQSDLDRVWNLCVALFLGATIYAFLSNDSVTAMGDLLKDNSASNRLATLNQSKRSLFQLLQWLPAMFLPMLLAQVYGAGDRLDWSTFSWWLRRQRKRPGYAQRYAYGLNISYPYFACCLFAASSANQRGLWFVAGLVALVAWALWLNRSPNLGWGAWLASFLLSLALGTGVQFGLLQMQRLVQRLDEVLLARWGNGRTWDVKENQTHLGTIGRMKLSGRIVFRLESNAQAPPERLREATYNVFYSPTWASTARMFQPVSPETNSTTWNLRRAAAPMRQVSIAGFFPSGASLLPVPAGIARLDQLPALDLRTNSLGSVRVEDAPGFAQWDASYSHDGSFDRNPTVEDLDIPPPERLAVQRVAAQLHLAELEPLEVVRAVERFFAEHFTYSMWQDERHRPDAFRTAITRFLLENRTGHCEYFATATTLLLRQAHIPARYAVGFSVQEKRGRYYVVRERHAHAWCTAWVDGAWRDVDTTPAGWSASEYSRASVWEPMRDLVSRLWFEFSRWRWGHAEWKRYLLWLIIPLLLLTFGRVLLQRQWRRSTNNRDPSRGVTPWPGRDSEFYWIERRLEQAGFQRQRGETGSAWLHRVGLTGAIPIEGLDALLASHYRLRFDPQGLSPSERHHFRQQALAWLKRADADLASAPHNRLRR
jgi:transglutaminase-like putative cysteine protease